MSTSKFMRTRGLRAGVSLIAVAAGLASMTGFAAAQGTTPETITVTGFRSSLEKALDLKRKSDTAVDAIYAEDIAKFPDLNLGDAIARVPGVSLQREGGEGRNISVRGLGPNFTRILVNGMEAQATNTSPDNLGGVDRNRQFDFNTFAPDLFNQIVVAKTQASETEEGSLGATVNLEMAHPLDDPGFHFAAGAKEGFNDLARTRSPRASFIISNTFWGDKLGILVSGSFTKRKYEDDGISNVREGSNFETAPGFASVAGVNFLDKNGNSVAACDNVTTGGSLTTACADGAVKPRFAGRMDEWKSDQTRRSGAIAIEFQPYEGTHFTLQGLTATFSVERSESQLEAPSFGTGTACTAGSGATIGSPNNSLSSCGVAQTTMIAGTIVDTGAPAFYSGTPPTAAFTGAAGSALVAGKDIWQITSGTFNNVDVRSEQRYDRYHTRFNQVTLNFDQTLTDRLKLSALAGYSASTFVQPVYALLIWDQFNVQGFGYNYGSVTNRTPAVNWGNANVTNPSAFVLDQIRLRPSSTDNSFQNYQANIDWDAWGGFHLKGGVDFKRYSFTTFQFGRAGPVANGQVYPITTPPGAGNPWTATTTFFSSGTNCATLAVNANAEACVPSTVGSINPAVGGFPAGVPNASYSGIVNFNTRGITSPAGNVTSWVGPNVKSAINVLGLLNPALFPVSHLSNLGANQNVDEKDTGFFLQGNFSGHFFGMPTHGNIGVRVVRTQQFAASPGLVAGAEVWQGSSRAYSNTLPSFNIVFEPSDNFLIRFGAAKVMVRPNLGDLVGTSLSVAGSTRSVTIGNPSLNPFGAKSYDLGLEWYHRKGALLSVGLFQKNITSLITSFSTSIIANTNPFGITDAQFIAACGAQAGCSPTVAWTFNERINAPGGSLKGIEVNLQEPFDFLPGFLHNFGLLANVTAMKSAVPVAFLSGSTFFFPLTADLQNLSRRNYNWTLYYDDGTLEARVSANFRSRYLNRVPSQVQQGNFDGINATTNYDASLTYELTKHLSLTAEGINLTDQFTDQFNSSADLPYVYHHTGREFFLGARLKY